MLCFQGLECDADVDAKYATVRWKAALGLAVWLGLMILVCVVFMSETGGLILSKCAAGTDLLTPDWLLGRYRFAFLTAKMEEKFYW